MPILELAAYVMIGLVAGGMGGLMGVGGSIIMIPALTVLFGHNFHLAQAAAMVVIVFVAVPATISHNRAKAVQWRTVWLMLPFGVAFIVVGVEVSNLFDGKILARVFAVFLLYVAAVNFRRLVSKVKRSEAEPQAKPVAWWRAGIVGSIVGFIAGVLGIGGGVVIVPLFQKFCGLPLRMAIATSSAVMCLTAVFGAARKNLTLSQHVSPDGVPLDYLDSFLIAACLAPSAFIGAYFGAKLTHILPVNAVRAVFVCLLAITSIEMLL